MKELSWVQRRPNGASTATVVVAKYATVLQSIRSTRFYTPVVSNIRSRTAVSDLSAVGKLQ